jgi:hypothetical protein
MPSRLFLEGGEGEIGYRNIRDGQSPPLVRARYHCEYLWTFFQHHCDRDFQKELRTNFHSSYWEMFLTVSLILDGYSVTCPKPIGPDVSIIYRGRRIWFEATTPMPGSILSPDKVDAPDMQTIDGQAAIFDTPNEKIVLRYLNSIKHKYQCQYQNWLKKGIVSQNDAFVVAPNPRAIQLDNADTRPARILQAAYPIGNETLTLNKETGKIVGRGVELRPYTEKATKTGAEPGDEKTKVETGVFATNKYAGRVGFQFQRAAWAHFASQRFVG